MFVGGLATDYCVKRGVCLDALDGERVKVLKDCVMGVNLHENDSDLALREVADKGAELVTSSNAVKQVAVGVE